MGPAVASYDKILQLIDAGMNVARINFSHGQLSSHLQTIQDLKKAREEKKVPLAIMMDTRGPEIRVGEIENGFITVEIDQVLFISYKKILGNSTTISITPSQALQSIQPGMKLLFDDGYISAEVKEIHPENIEIVIQNGGILKSHKSIGIPNAHVHLPCLTEQDIEDITFACQNDVDWIAASFIRSADHVFEIQKLLASQGKSDIFVIAKIENILGVQNFDAIVQVSDGIMIARGDLGIELPLEEVPALQKKMIRKCAQVAKPVVTATQMLESMIQYPRPTRAEVSDVANAIYDSSSAVMLSGETAIGKFPIESVKVMKNIIYQAEEDFSYRDFYQHAEKDFTDVSSSLACAAVQTAYSSEAKAIFAFTTSGKTAQQISRFRPRMPILAMTPNLKTYHQMALYWDILPVKGSYEYSLQEAVSETSSFALKEKIIQQGDLVVVITGSPIWVKGATNTMIVESIGDVIVRAQKGHGKQIRGKVVALHTSESRQLEEIKGKIAILSHCDASYEALLNQAIGIVLQNHPEDKSSEKEAMMIAKNYDIPIVVRAKGALSILRDGQMVTLDPSKRVVYQNIV